MLLLLSHGVNHVHHLSYERLEQVLEEVLGLKISQGAIDNILQRTAQRLEPESEKIRQTVQSSRVVGSDETGVRMDGQNYWQWVFQTPQASYYVIAPSRGTQVITDVMEEAVPEVWVSDLFSAQQKAPTLNRQTPLRGTKQSATLISCAIYNMPSTRNGVPLPIKCSNCCCVPSAF